MDLSEAKSIVDDAIQGKKMVLIVGECDVHYHGRAASKLSSGERLVVLKGDGSFLVHQNKGMAAINYQPPKGTITTQLADGVLIVKASRNKPHEVLEALFSTVRYAQAFHMRDDSSLSVIGTEKDLAKLIMDSPDLVEEGLVIVNQESPVAKGAIDIFARDKDGKNVVIEVKRRTAGLKEVTQLFRYVDDVSKRMDKGCRGMLVAPAITDAALTMLAGRGMQFRALGYEVSDSPKITSVAKKQKGLTEFF